MDPGGWLPFLNELADAADKVALRHFRSVDLHVEEKPKLGPVTEADLGIETLIRRLCRERHPDLGVYGEEQGETGEDRPQRLIIDPIDATRNFVRGIPIFATLLAIEVEREVVAGLVSAPALATRWTAARGCGAYEQDRQLRVSGVRDLARAQVFHGSIGGIEGAKEFPGLLHLLQASERQRGFGDFYQHVLVAGGTGEVSIDPLMSPWDIAPLLLIVEEAGGRATSLQGERSIHGGSLVCSNGLLHEAALEMLHSTGQPKA
jgi:histidinol-phosphatase